MWSCWPTATDSISFRGVSKSAIDRSFVFLDPSSGTMLAFRHSSVSLPRHPHLSPVFEGAEALKCALQCFQVGVSRSRPTWFSSVFRHFHSRHNSFLGQGHSSISSGTYTPFFFLRGFSESDLCPCGDVDTVDGLLHRTISNVLM